MTPVPEFPDAHEGAANAIALALTSAITNAARTARGKPGYMPEDGWHPVFPGFTWLVLEGRGWLCQSMHKVEDTAKRGSYLRVAYSTGKMVVFSRWAFRPEVGAALHLAGIKRYRPAYRGLDQTLLTKHTFAGSLFYDLYEPEDVLPYGMGRSLKGLGLDVKREWWDTGSAPPTA